MSDFLLKMNAKQMTEQDVRMMSPLKLAYLGDAIYEAYIRVYVISKVELSTHEMSQLTIKYVNAGAQATMVHKLKEMFTEEEWTIIKRGRNQKTSSVPKNASVSDYRYATGFEALMGYLYLLDQKERIYEIIQLIIEYVEDEVRKES